MLHDHFTFRTSLAGPSTVAAKRCLGKHGLLSVERSIASTHLSCQNNKSNMLPAQWAADVKDSLKTSVHTQCGAVLGHRGRGWWQCWRVQMGRDMYSRMHWSHTKAGVR